MAAKLGYDTEDRAARERRRATLMVMSKVDLVSMVLNLEGDVASLTSNLNIVTQNIPLSELAPDLTRPGNGEAAYVDLPASRPVVDESGKRRSVWRIRLVTTDNKYKPIGIAIYDDVLIGRISKVSTPDLDMTLYGGASKGISRKHAIVRPSKDALYLIDLNSTNGSYRNGNRLEPGHAQQLYDNDTISLGDMHFVIRIDGQPEQDS